MATLIIEGKRVTVDDAFLSLTPEQQADTVDEIASQIGILPQPVQAQAAAVPPVQDSGPQGSNIAAKGDRRPGHQIGSNIASAIAQGPTLGAADEITSALRAPVQMGVNALTGEGPTSFGENFAQNQAEEAAQLAATRQANPTLAPAAEIAGGVSALGGSVATGIAKGSSLAQKAIIGTGTGAGIGAAQGFATGDDFEGRVQQAKTGAVAGGVIGSSAPLLSKAVGSLARVVSSPSKKVATRTLNVSKEVLKRIRRGFDDSVSSGSLRKPEPGDLLLDLSPQFRGQAEAIATQPGAAGQSILNAVFSRQQGAGGRIQAVLDSGLGTDKGRAVVRSVAQQERKAAGRMFEAAKKSTSKFNIDPIRGRINEVADGIVGQGDLALRAFLDKIPEGVVGAKTLHFTRMALDDAISTAFKGGRKNLGATLKDIRRDVDEQLKTVRGWPEADAAFVLAKNREGAFDAGRGVFQRSGSPDELGAELSTMSPPVKRAFIQGARDAVSTIMGTARNDAAAAIRELAQKGWSREKLELLLGKNSAQKVIRALEREKRFADTTTVLAGNSRTAMRQAGQREFPNPVDTSTNFQQSTAGGLTGITANTLRKLVDVFAGGVLSRRNARISEEAAQLLTASGLDRDRIIAELTRLNQAKGRALNRQEIAQHLVNAIAVPSAGPASQLATQ